MPTASAVLRGGKKVGRIDVIGTAWELSRRPGFPRKVSGPRDYSKCDSSLSLEKQYTSDSMSPQCMRRDGYS